MIGSTAMSTFEAVLIGSLWALTSGNGLELCVAVGSATGRELWMLDVSSGGSLAAAAAFAAAFAAASGSRMKGVILEAWRSRSVSAASCWPLRESPSRERRPKVEVVLRAFLEGGFGGAGSFSGLPLSLPHRDERSVGARFSAAAGVGCGFEVEESGPGAD